MRIMVRAFPLAIWLGAAAPALAPAQAPPTSARVETAPLDLKASDRYQVPSILEPIRRVTLVATADGVVRNQDTHVGDSVRESQEIAQLDRAEASARLKVAQAIVKEQQAALQEQLARKADKASVAQAEARLEAARARAELAQLELDSCTLRAPFGGRLLAAHVSDGQYVAKGTAIAELADISTLRALVPVTRSSVKAGGKITVLVEGQPLEGKVQAVIPLPEVFAVLHELSTAFAAAWVIFPNAKGTVEPGQRVLSPALPTLPIANVSARALHQPEAGEGAPSLQVIRNEYVTNVPVQVLGHPGPDRVQIAGPLRHSDSLIVSSSVPLLAGTFVRFSGAASAGLEGTSPNPSEAGAMAGITPPGGSSAATATRAAPAAAASGARAPTRASAPAPAATRTAPKPATGVVPF